jgi:cell filamentation protein
MPISSRPSVGSSPGGRCPPLTLLERRSVRVSRDRRSSQRPRIEDLRSWRQAEADFTRLRIARLLRTRIDGQYDLTHLRAFHRFIFEGFYEWAGELRTVEISKTAPFCQLRFLHSSAATTFGRLAHELLGADGRVEFLDRLTVHFGEVNALHPFREGNGRAQRAFFAQLAGDAGYVIDWSRVDPAQNAEAARASLRGDDAQLRGLLDEITATAG